MPLSRALEISRMEVLLSAVLSSSPSSAAVVVLGCGDVPDWLRGTTGGFDWLEDEEEDLRNLLVVLGGSLAEGFKAGFVGTVGLEACCCCGCWGSAASSGVLGGATTGGEGGVVFLPSPPSPLDRRRDSGRLAPILGLTFPPPVSFSHSFLRLLMLPELCLLSSSAVLPDCSCVGDPSRSSSRFLLSSATGFFF
uniref:Putative secreted protein n=1 Tax=Ixodes ricinus TaxID=34613 RepID=A0A6B0V0M9_IXORI